MFEATSPPLEVMGLNKPEDGDNIVNAEKAEMPETEEVNTEEENVEARENVQSLANPLAQIAALAANKGKKLSGSRTPSVYEGEGYAKPKAESKSEQPSPRPGHSHLVGGVRVMPGTNEEMQKVLAARLRKSE